MVTLLVATGAAAYGDDAATTTTTTAPPTTSTTTTTTTTTTPTTPTTPTTTPPADAPTTLVSPGVTVTPSTDLVNLQLVTVAGSGFTPHASVGWAECRNNGSGAPGDCDLSRIGAAAADASGAFSASYAVHRILHTANGDVDCAAAPATCILAAGNSSTPSTEHASTPLTFDPDAPLPPPPTLLAGPLDGLVDGDGVAVFGGGFVPSSPVVLVECSEPTASTCQTLGTVTANASGGFITTVHVHRLLVVPPFFVADCAAAPGTCQLRAVSLADYDREAHVLLSFDPAGPLPPATVTVSPQTGLVNFQGVTVTGSKFPASGFVQIAMCKTGATSYEECSGSPVGFAILNGSGGFSTTVSVRRILHLEGGDFDCASTPDGCSLVSSSFGPTPVAVASPISFDASVPPPPPPTITVTPSTDLVQGQSVTVTGAHFEPNSFVSLGECTTDGAASGSCSSGGISGAVATTDAGGAFSTSFALRRGVLDSTTYPPAVVDCASAPQRCSLVAIGGSSGEDHAAQAIDFDPSVPLARPDVSVTPQFGLPDRGVIHVHSSGLRPGEHVVVSECPGDAPVPTVLCGAQPGPIPFLTADSTGVVDTHLRVHRDLTTRDGVVIIFGQTSCADSIGACVVRVQSIDDPLVSRDVPLGFDPTAVAPPPQLTLSATGPFADGQQVEVHGTGFTPDATLGMAECEAGVDPNGRTCGSDLFTEFRADDDGAFTRTVTLHVQVDGTDGPIACTGASSCVLFAANRADYGAERVGVPIEFGAAAAGTPPAVVEPARALAFTGAGAATRPLAAVGLGLLLVGAALVLVARRRAS